MQRFAPGTGVRCIATLPSTALVSFAPAPGRNEERDLGRPRSEAHGTRFGRADASRRGGGRHQLRASVPTTGGNRKSALAAAKRTPREMIGRSSDSDRPLARARTDGRPQRTASCCCRGWQREAALARYQRTDRKRRYIKDGSARARTALRPRTFLGPMRVPAITPATL